MFRKLYFILILLSFFEANAEIVNKLEVLGNKRISSETIKVYGEIEFGKDYSNVDLNMILKNLYSTNFFEDIKITLNNNILKIELTEYPIINSINLIGEKSNTMKKFVLDKLKLREKESFISSLLVEDVDLLKKIYSSQGYNFVQIDTKVEKFSENRINLLYEIKKNEKTFIRNIYFAGDKKINDSTLSRLIASEEKKFWKILSKNVYYNQSNIELDKRLLLNYYKSIGYYDVQILSKNAEIKDNFVDLTYIINAGTRFKINRISTSVDQVIDKSIFEPLYKNYSNLIGKYYSPFKVKKLLDEVDLLIADNDLQFVEHSINEIVEKDNIEIKINIFESKKEIVERINILGNNVTDESVIRAELLLDEGDPLNLLKLDKSIANINSRNLFAEVKKNILDGSKINQKIIEITVEEKPTGEISAGAGIGTTGGSFSFKISENNWLGKGLNVSTSLDVSSETFTGELSITDPNYNYSGNSLNYYIANTKNDKPDSGFKNNILSLGIGTKFEQYKDTYLSPSINFSYDDLKVESSASTALKKQKGKFTDLSFDYSFITDKRDRTFGPTDGYLTSFSQAFPIYADSPFIKNSFLINKYMSFSPNVIGAVKFYTAAINGINNEDVRLSKRLRLPSNRLRGFESGKIGPKDGNDFIGGNYVASTNFEINLPKLLPESTKTDISLFLDFGNIWHVDYDTIIDDSNKIRSSTGVNASWLSPVGPMSFIFSQNLSKASTDVTETFNFRLGTTF